VEGLDLYRHPETSSKRDGLVVGFAAPAPSAWSAALDALIRELS
jgi:GntR family transcriptional regulator/MocR family aminotransferase